MMMSIPNPMWELEIRVLSCEGLNLINNSSSSPLCSLLMSNSNPMITGPFISLTKLPPSHGDQHPNFYTSRLEVEGDGSGEGGLFRVPADSSFLSDKHSCLHLQLYTKRPIVGPSQLGWCLIPASDFGPLPAASVRHLSYRLRARDGSRGPAIINLSVQFKATSCDVAPAIGIPVEPIGTMKKGDTESGRQDYS